MFDEVKDPDVRQALLFLREELINKITQAREEANVDSKVAGLETRINKMRLRTNSKGKG